MMWLDPHNPAVRSAVVSGVWGKAPHSEEGHPLATEEGMDLITNALDVASNILTPLAAYRVHPAGIAVEDFRATPRAHRLTLNYSPIRRIVSVERVLDDSLEELDTTWTLVGESLRFEQQGSRTWPGLV